MFTVFAGLISLAGAPMSSPPPAPLPQWLVGCWSHAADGQLSVQRWTAGGSATLFGAWWTASGDSLVRLDVVRMWIGVEALGLDLVPVVPPSELPESLRGPASDTARDRMVAFGAGGVRIRVQFHQVGSDAMRVVHERAEHHAAPAATARVYRRVRCSEVLRADPNAAAAIRRLHEADEHAVVAGDADALERLWTDDIVAVAPGSTPRAGRAANAAAMRRSLAETKALITVSYSLVVDDLHVVGEHAVEWGRYEGRVRTGPDTPIVSAEGSMLRVLRRGDDGAWRVARTMFTAGP